ncbi:MAG: PilZ domain-containing protein [Candidatus Omnitrophota bacterium]
MVERRRAERRIGVLEVHYHLRSKLTAGGSLSTNVSDAGLRFPVRQKLEPGTLLDLEIYSRQTQEHIFVSAKVVWLKELKSHECPFEIGVAFLHLQPADLETLEVLMNKFQKGQSDISWID